MNFSAGFVMMVLFFASCLLSESDGLRCYGCINCKDPFNSDEADIRECTTSCTKAKSSDGVIRACAGVKGGDSCVEVNADGITGDLCTCNSDLCNGSPIQILSYSATVTTLLISYILKFAM